MAFIRTLQTYYASNPQPLDRNPELENHKPYSLGFRGLGVEGFRVWGLRVSGFRAKEAPGTSRDPSADDAAAGFYREASPKPRAQGFSKLGVWFSGPKKNGFRGSLGFRG